MTKVAKTGAKQRSLATSRSSPLEGLLEQVLARQVELVVMSTHGHRGLARWALGSVAERVAHSAPVLVLLLPAAAPATLTAGATPGAASIARLLVPLDQSAKAEAALPLALELAQVLEAEVRLLGVIVPQFEEGAGSEALQAWKAARCRLHEAEQYLLSQVQAAQQARVSVHWSLGYGLLGAKRRVVRAGRRASQAATPLGAAPHYPDQRRRSRSACYRCTDQRRGNSG